MLVVMSLGKAANVLGGTGQGLPSGLDWATSYLGPGPWGSLGPGIPSFPAQAAEALAVALLLVVVAGTWAVGGLRAHDGRGFALALGGWAAIRFAVAGTWRDPIVVGPFRAEQVIDLAIVGLALLILVGLFARARRGRPVGPARAVAGRPANPEAGGPAKPEDRVPAKPEGRRPARPAARGPAKPEDRGPARPKARRPAVVEAQPDPRGPTVVDVEPDGVSSVTDTPPPRGLR
jgi:hypothetical protein